MAKLSYTQLKAYIANVVTEAGLSNASFVETRDNVVGLLDKIGKILTLDTFYQVDKLTLFDGEFLGFGKTIEEWQEDLIMPVDYDSTGANALAPHDPTYRPVFYSYTNGKKTIPTTIRYNNIERAVHFEAQFIEIVAMNTKRLDDSMAVYRYGLKREILGKLMGLCSTAMGTTTTFTTGTNYKVGAFVRSASSGQNIKKAVVVKEVPATNSDNFATNVANGYLIVLDLVTEIAPPTDTSTGEAFIKQVKKDVEIASDLSEGHSLNGNSLGATEGLVLIVKQGIIPELEVDTYAGAFNRGDLATNVEQIIVKDFGNADDDYFAILMDRRGARLHDTNNASYENLNGEGAFMNIYRHIETTSYISRNTFVKVYKKPQA